MNIRWFCEGQLWHWVLLIWKSRGKDLILSCFQSSGKKDLQSLFLLKMFQGAVNYISMLLIQDFCRVSSISKYTGEQVWVFLTEETKWQDFPLGANNSQEAVHLVSKAFSLERSRAQLHRAFVSLHLFIFWFAITSEGSISGVFFNDFKVDLDNFLLLPQWMQLSMFGAL